MRAPGQVRKPLGVDLLDEVVDTDIMSRRLAPLIEATATFRVVSARVVGTVSEERAVIEYRTVDGEAPSLFGKVYADPERARRLNTLLTELHELDAAGHGCGVPRPLGYLPEFGMAVFVPARGRSLEQLEGTERSEGMAAAGRWLATLHSSTIGLDRRLDLASETRNVGEWAQLVVDYHPAAAQAIDRLLERIRSLAPQIAVSSRSPIHKDFHYQHVLVDRGRVVVIDLDEMRAGDPAFDIAHFGANLRLLSLREQMAGYDLARLESAFLAGYTSLRPYEPDSRHEFFHAYTCVKIAKQLVRGRGPAPVPTGAERSRQLELILAEGLGDH
jgi:aminoglycoside phosphotransferase (APT) family kinase protein